jgi:hypothetical protein
MTFDPTQARDQRTAIRTQLWDNGFTPLPNLRKMCLMPNWSREEITRDMVTSRAWQRMARFQDTGLRCGEIIAIDFDVNDKALLNDLLDALVAENIIPESRFVRIGRPPREMWVYRTADKIGKRTTGFFAPQNATEGDKAEQVEVLGNGCQFAAYGQRDENTWYAWPDQNLLDYKYMDLPEITLAQVEAMKNFAIAFFEKRGLLRKSREGGTDSGYTKVFDLKPEMVFEIQNAGEMTIAEIEAYLHQHPDEVLRCRVDELRPGTSGSWAGMISLSNDLLCLSDHGSYTSHFPANANGEEDFLKLGKLMENLPTPALFANIESKASGRSQVDLSMSPDRAFDDNMAIALQRFAYIKETDTIVDAMTNTSGMTVQHFKNFSAQYYSTETGPRGGMTVTMLADLWLREPGRCTVKQTEMRPDKPFPFFTESDVSYYNTYRPLTLPTGGTADMGFDLLEKLLPVEAERHYFTQWLAYKLMHPDVRGPGIIMVANDEYGTGRGSLIEMIKMMFAPNLVREIDFETLSGKGTQGQYNEWLVDALLVAVNEAQEASGSKWQQRISAYEHLKEIVDPGKHSVYVKRKGLNNYMGRTSASILVMTNHMDSVAIPAGDRRFAILENGERQPPEYWKAFHAWRSDPRNIGAMVEKLLQYSLEGYDPFVAPPVTASKLDMVEASGSALDRGADFVLNRCKGPLLTREQLQLGLEEYLSEYSVEFPDDWRRVSDRIFNRRTRRVPGIDAVRIEGKMRFVRALGFCPEFANEDEIIATVLLNGPMSRQIGGSGNVVNFAARK